MNRYFKTNAERKYFITKEGLDSLKRRLDELTLRRLKTIQKLRLMDEKDKLERLNVSEEIYDIEQSDQEISELHHILQKVEPVVKPSALTTVRVGYTVELDTGVERSVFTIVSPLEVDIETGRISEECPLGQALLGKSMGDTISITTPKGEEKFYTIISIT